MQHLLLDLRNVHEAILLYADVYKGAEVGNIRHQAGKAHAYFYVLHCFYGSIKLESFNWGTGVAAGFLQFFDDIFYRVRASAF